MLKLPLLVTCRCGHGRDAHQHYRPGSDCSLCDCMRFLVRLGLPGRRGERHDGAAG